MEVADIKYIEDQLKAQFEAQKEIFEQKYNLLARQYDKLFERYNELLDKFKQNKLYNPEEFDSEEM